MMKILLLVISLHLSNNTSGNTNLIGDKQNRVFMSFDDTCNPKLAQFRKFAKMFFEAVEADDIVFLKKHIRFPIPTKSFSDYDSTLKGLKTIGTKAFFKRIHKLFPDELISRIDTDAEYSSNALHSPRNFSITVYRSADGFESNCTWEFYEEDCRFYFSWFRAEAG